MSEVAAIKKQIEGMEARLVYTSDTLTSEPIHSSSTYIRTYVHVLYF